MKLEVSSVTNGNTRTGQLWRDPSGRLKIWTVAVSFCLHANWNWVLFSVVNGTKIYLHKFCGNKYWLVVYAVLMWR